MTVQGALLDADTLQPESLDITKLEACFERFSCYAVTSPPQVLDRLQYVDVAIVNNVVLDASILQNLPNLRHILIAATGTNNVDLAAARRLGISVQNCQGYGVSSVAQHTMMLILALSTRLLDYHQAVKTGLWSKSPFFCLLDFPVLDLSGKKLGIIGYGELGKAVADLAIAFGMDVQVVALPGRATHGERVPLDVCLSQVDVLSIHCPLTPETTNLIGAKQLQLMRQSSLLINCARGGIVNENDLLTALQKQQIAGAALDVLTKEPPHPNHPLLQYQGNNLIITPHTAWASKKARQTIIDQLVANLQSIMSGTFKFLVN